MALGAGIAHHAAGGRHGGSARQRLLTALAAGALHGALTGSGGFSPGALSLGERARDTALGAGLGAAVGGLTVPGVRAAGDVANNLPAMLGREMLAEGSLTPGVRPQFVQRALGQGTRRGAPLELSFAGEGDASTRAARAIQSALSQDEAAAALGRGGARFGRFANAPGGRDVLGFASDTLGPSLMSTRSLAASAPGGAQQLEGMANNMIEDALRARMRAMRAPAVPGGARAASARPLNGADASDLVATVNEPALHQSWINEARNLTQSQRARLAVRVVRQLRADATLASSRGGSEAFSRAIREPLIAQKLEALGVRTQAIRGARRADNMSGDSAIDAEVERLRRLAVRPDDFRFGNYEDADLARAGTLHSEDALAMIEALRQPQRAYAVRPNRSARVLSGQYQRGVRLDPGSYFRSNTPDDLLRSILLSQPAAAGLGGMMFGGHG
jgi:hypothetical protein